MTLLSFLRLWTILACTTLGQVIRTLVVLPLLALLLALGVSAEPERAAATIRIASEGARPPYNFLDGDDLAGFEIELGRELCARMRVSCSFVVEQWDGLVPGLLEHRYDAIMAAIEITREADAKIAFSDPYVRMPASFLAMRETESTGMSAAGLAGRRIGVESEGPHEAYARHAYPGCEILAYASLEDAILDLAEARLDLVLASRDSLSEFLSSRREGQCCQILADVPYDAAYQGEGIGIGLRHEDGGLRAQFNKALAALRADGTFDRIRARYFSFDILPGVSPAPITGTRESNGGQVSAVR